MKFLVLRTSSLLLTRACSQADDLYSSFAGLAAMAITFPLPGWVATKVNAIAKERAKKTDARVQEVTESTSPAKLASTVAG